MNNRELTQILNNEVNQQVVNQQKTLDKTIDDVFKALENGPNGFTKDQKEAIRSIATIAMKSGAGAGAISALNVLGDSMK